MSQGGKRVPVKHLPFGKKELDTEELWRPVRGGHRDSSWPAILHGEPVRYLGGCKADIANIYTTIRQAVDDGSSECGRADARVAADDYEAAI
jgi:hypothetical protein